MQLKNGFFQEQGSKNRHQAYKGGLADHSFAVALESYHSAASKPYLCVDTDDAIIAGLFHDLDKMGHVPHTLRIKNDDETCKMLALFGLLNEQVKNGIFFAHGGWSTDPDKVCPLCKQESFRTGLHQHIAIIVHEADMIASQIIKTERETQRLIVNILCSILRESRGNNCPFCKKESIKYVDHHKSCTVCKISARI